MPGCRGGRGFVVDSGVFRLDCRLSFFAARGGDAVHACGGLTVTAVFVVVAVGSLNFISASVPVLFIGLGVDFGIQFGLRYREELSRVGDHEAALTACGRGRRWGVDACGGCRGLKLFFLPSHVISRICGNGAHCRCRHVYRPLCEPHVVPGTADRVSAFTVPCCESHENDRSRFPEHPVMGSIIRYRRVILGGLIPVVLVSVVVVPRLQFDFHALHLRDPSTESVSTFQELLADPDTSPYVIQVLADKSPAADALAESLRSVPEVDRVLTLSSFVPGDQEEKLTIIDEMALVLEPVLIPQRSLILPVKRKKCRP